MKFNFFVANWIYDLILKVEKNSWVTKFFLNYKKFNFSLQPSFTYLHAHHVISLASKGFTFTRYYGAKFRHTQVKIPFCQIQRRACDGASKTVSISHCAQRKGIRRVRLKLFMECFTNSRQNVREWKKKNPQHTFIQRAFCIQFFTLKRKLFAPEKCPEQTFSGRSFCGTSKWRFYINFTNTVVDVLNWWLMWSFPKYYNGMFSKGYWKSNEGLNLCTRKVYLLKV